MSKKSEVVHNNIENVGFVEAISERYLTYALSTIMSRSLPDVRDGLKPVHRRVIYAMHVLRLDPASGYKKCARIVGDVMGKFHPHGDASIYDSLVRLAQDFSVRYPLVDGQGNFGSIDGDNAAAMRYTESRLTPIALELITDLDEDTVDFRQTYDGQEQEPLILPARFPNVLANGSEGIAVGMATSIPPHNLDELCSAMLALIDDPAVTVAQLCNFVQGPDFPTGGILLEDKERIVQCYVSGRGSLRLRAKWESEPLKQGNYQVVVTEIPYQVSKSKLIEQIANFIHEKKLPLLGTIRDESSDLIRIVFEPKSRTITAEQLMASLFKRTELEIRFNVNLNVLTHKGVPEVLSLKGILQEFLLHRHVVLLRRSRHRLSQIEHRAEVLEGLRVAYLNIDRVIQIIREEDEPKTALMQEWSLSEIQAEAILNMRLRNLRKLEESQILDELAKLRKEQAALQGLLADVKKQWRWIRDDIVSLQKSYNPEKYALNARRTLVVEAQDEPEDVAYVESMAEREPIMVLCSTMGWIRAMKGHLEEQAKDARYKEGDQERFICKAYTTDKLLVVTSLGKCYSLTCDKLPGGKGQGDPIRQYAELAPDEEIVLLRVYSAAERFLFVNSDAKGFITSATDMLASTRTGKQIMNLDATGKLFACKPVLAEHIAIIGENRKLLIFPVAELPEMKRGQGVTLQKYKQGGPVDLAFVDVTKGISWQTGGKTRNETNLLPWIAKRGTAGRMAPFGFPRDNRFTD